MRAVGCGMRERLWWAVEWNCTKMESVSVFSTPDLSFHWVPSGVSWGTAIDQPILTSSGRQSAGLEVGMRQVGCAGPALVGCGVELHRN